MKIRVKIPAHRCAILKIVIVWATIAHHVFGLPAKEVREMVERTGEWVAEGVKMKSTVC